jgi:hypothetical protein
MASAAGGGGASVTTGPLEIGTLRLSPMPIRESAKTASGETARAAIRMNLVSFMAEKSGVDELKK